MTTHPFRPPPSFRRKPESRRDGAAAHKWQVLRDGAPGCGGLWSYPSRGHGRPTRVTQSVKNRRRPDPPTPPAWMPAFAGMTKGWIPARAGWLGRPWRPVPDLLAAGRRGLPPRPLVPDAVYCLDRLFPTRSTAYIPVGAHPCRRAHIMTGVAVYKTIKAAGARLPLHRHLWTGCPVCGERAGCP